MKRARKKERPNYKNYPKPKRIRSGARVAWYYYDNKKDAELCSEAAIWNAEISRGYGYDFGFAAPGSIHETENGELEVCIP